MKFEMKKNEDFPRFLQILKILKNLGKFSFFSFQTSFFFILQAISIEKPRNCKKLGKSLVVFSQFPSLRKLFH